MNKIVVNDSAVEQTVYATDEMTGDVTVERRFDIAPVLQNIKDLKSISDGKGQNFWHIGKVPLGVIEEYCNKRGITYGEFLKNKDIARQFLTDPDYSHFRIYEGNI